MTIRVTRDRANKCLLGVYKFDGMTMIMLPGYIIDFPRKEGSPDGEILTTYTN